jgi:acyl-coenzyme A thioesterase PaaI-like protein
MVTMTQAFDAKAMEARMRQVFEEIVPFNRVLGLKIESVDPEAPKIRFDMRPDLVGNPLRQILHGGVISATLDVTAGLAIQLALLAQGTDEPGGINFPHGARQRRRRPDRDRQRRLCGGVNWGMPMRDERQ